jgi:hypothetical protein
VIVVDVLTWVLRLMGVGYFVGGVWMARQMWFWAQITPSMNKLTQTIEEFKAEVRSGIQEMRTIDPGSRPASAGHSAGKRWRSAQTLIDRT